jgi:hypothetical protein
MRTSDRAAVLSSHVLLALENGRLLCRARGVESARDLGSGGGIALRVNNPTPTSRATSTSSWGS